MHPNYLNDDAKAFMSQFPKAQQETIEAIVDELKKRFPMADHWTTGGENFRYTDIRIGRKARHNLKGLPVFYLREDGTVHVNKRARVADLTSVLRFDAAPTREEIAAWFNANHLSGAGFARLEGAGLNPSDYPDDARPEVDAENDIGNEEPAAESDSAPAEALNRILYGPPGTGKTYRTIGEALRIIEGTKTPGGDFDEQKARFDALRAEGRIAFVTFHQSFSYEDFIEGIRAEVVDGQLGYKVRDGIFKKLAITAMYRRPSVIEHDSDIPFDTLYDEFLKEVSASLPYKLSGTRGGVLEIKTVNANGTLQLTHPGRTMRHGVSRNRMSALYKAYPALSDLQRNSASSAITDVIGGANSTVYWAVLNCLLHFKETVREELAADPAEMLSPTDEFEYEQIKQRVLAAEKLLPNTQPYVLIIDEINRGNMSRVFGELITLIETSKRAGRRETVEVQLPYSNERFSVPANLYIIGTMNTADRSLALVDTALRRRFDFVEMMPDPDLLKVRTLAGVDLVSLLKAINRRIEHLYDREHMIGHSFFMELTEDSSIDDLALIFKNKVLPLLEEYFFEDWEKISKILGKARIYEVQPASDLGFAAAGPTYRRNLDRLKDAATYQDIYRAGGPSQAVAPVADDNG